MRFRGLLGAIVLASVIVSGCTTTQSNGANEAEASNAQDADSNLNPAAKRAKRQSLDDLASRTVQELVATSPSISGQLAKAYGYAVFDDSVYNPVLYMDGLGNGVAYVNATGAPTYMIMLHHGSVPGHRDLKYRQVLLFSTEDAFRQFTTIGFAPGTPANDTVGTAQAGDGTVATSSFDRDMDVYTITDSGVDLQADWDGTQYLRNVGLND